MSRVRIKKWTVDEDALKAYLDHLMMRLAGIDPREAESFEQVMSLEEQRTKLHNAVIASVEPHLETISEFNEALSNYVENEFGGMKIGSLIALRDMEGV